MNYKLLTFLLCIFGIRIGSCSSINYESIVNYSESNIINYFDDFQNVLNNARITLEGLFYDIHQAIFWKLKEIFPRPKELYETLLTEHYFNKSMTVNINLQFVRAYSKYIEIIDDLRRELLESAVGKKYFFENAFEQYKNITNLFENSSIVAIDGEKQVCLQNSKSDCKLRFIDKKLNHLIKDINHFNMSVVKEVLEKFEFFNQNNTLVQNLNLFINYVTQSGYMSQTDSFTHFFSSEDLQNAEKNYKDLAAYEYALDLFSQKNIEKNVIGVKKIMDEVVTGKKICYDYVKLKYKDCIQDLKRNVLYQVLNDITFFEDGYGLFYSLLPKFGINNDFLYRKKLIDYKKLFLSYGNILTTLRHLNETILNFPLNKLLTLTKESNYYTTIEGQKKLNNVLSLINTTCKILPRTYWDELNNYYELNESIEKRLLLLAVHKFEENYKVKEIADNNLKQYYKPNCLTYLILKKYDIAHELVREVMRKSRGDSYFFINVYNILCQIFLSFDFTEDHLINKSKDCLNKGYKRYLEKGFDNEMREFNFDINTLRFKFENISLQYMENILNTSNFYSEQTIGFLKKEEFITIGEGCSLIEHNLQSSILDKQFDEISKKIIAIQKDISNCSNELFFIAKLKFQEIPDVIEIQISAQEDALTDVSSECVKNESSMAMKIQEILVYSVIRNITGDPFVCEDATDMIYSLNGITQDSIHGIKEICYESPKNCQAESYLKTLTDLSFRTRNFPLDKIKNALKNATYLTTSKNGINDMDEYISMGRECNFIS